MDKKIKTWKMLKNAHVTLVKIINIKILH